VASGAWTTATLSVPRSDLVAVSLGNLAFFAGGWNATYAPSTVYNTVDIYDTSNASWRTATLSQARGALAATSVGNFVLFGGGWNFSPSSSVTYNVVDIYDATSNTWTTATLSVARAFLRATSIASRWALFAGGQNENMSFNTVDIYDSLNRTWSTATLSQLRADLAATSFGNWAFFAGGDNSTVTTIATTFNVIDIFNSTSLGWSTATLSQARKWLAAASTGEIVVFGGGSPDGYSSTNVVDIYNPTSGSWSTLTLSQARYYLAAASSSNQIVFAGGAISGGLNATTYSNVVDILSVSVPSPPPSTPPSPKSSVAQSLRLGNFVLYKIYRRQHIVHVLIVLFCNHLGATLLIGALIMNVIHILQ
jgi:kelch-like protein 20